MLDSPLRNSNQWRQQLQVNVIFPEPWDSKSCTLNYRDFYKTGIEKCTTRPFKVFEALLYIGQYPDSLNHIVYRDATICVE